MERSIAMRPPYNGDHSKRLRPFIIKFRLCWLAVIRQRAMFTNRIRALENPVLPRRQAPKNLGVLRFRSGKSERRFHTRERIRRQRGALFDSDAQFVVPV